MSATRPHHKSESPTVLWLITHLFRAVFCIALVVVLSYLSFCVDLKPATNVLIILPFSDRAFYPALTLLKSTVQSHIQEPVNLRVEYLESQRFEDPTESFRRA